MNSDADSKTKDNLNKALEDALVDISKSAHACYEKITQEGLHLM